MNRILTSLFFLGCSHLVSAQFDHVPVFPTLQDDALRQALIAEYKTTTVLDYSDARDTFMRNIDGRNGTLECVYTGFTIELDDDEDPTTQAFSLGINTEHSYPRSKGALEGTLAYSDMHHLFPTREKANTDRGSLILSDVPDNQTDKWYLDDDIITNIPSSNIDSYSELLTNEAFEPREEHKGDVARAYFYFYTLYQSQADNAAPNFFELQRETMCAWHFIDAVDEKEWTRNQLIAPYQDDKVNPFILDCRLARLYCDDIVGYCAEVSTNEVSNISIHLSPNPTQERLSFSDKQEWQTYTILRSDGQRVSSGYVDRSGDIQSVPVSDLTAGLYILRLMQADQRTTSVSKFIKL